MDKETSDKLAEIYNPAYPQIITIFPNVWKHEVGGKWFILKVLDGDTNV